MISCKNKLDLILQLARSHCSILSVGGDDDVYIFNVLLKFSYRSRFLTMFWIFH